MDPTISDIARQVGMARSTVADILRGREGYAPETCRRVLAAAERVHYIPNHFASALKRQKSQTVGVGGHMGLSSVTADTLKAISEGLLGRGYMPLFCECSFQPEGSVRAARELRKRMVDGIILESGCDEAELEGIFPDGFPVVLLRYCESRRWPCVVADRAQAMADGVRWLANLGHRRIAFVTTDMVACMRSPHNSQRLKIEGYRSAMEELGLFDESLLIECGIRPGDPHQFVLERPGLFASITAVITGNDRIAIEIMSAMADIGLRVPQDVSVIGWNDSEFAQAVRPRLTSFQPRRTEIGATAVEMVLKQIEGQPVENVTFVPELIVRESTGPCRRRQAT